MSSPYSQLCILDVENNGIGRKQFELSYDSLPKGIELNEVSAEVDRDLLEISQIKKETSQALLFLRCRVSHPISEKVKRLFKNFQEKYELDLKDMLSCVLDDSGEIFLRLPQRTNTGNIETLRKPFSWETLSELSRKEIRPFGAEVIYNFDPNLSNLSTWAKNKVQANSELKRYLRNQGLLMISPWALIADSTSTRVKEAWQRCGDGNLQLQEVELIHNSYLSQYKEAKAIFKKTTGKNSGWVPDADFLASLNPPQKDRNSLLAIDKAIRQYLAGTGFSRQFKDGEESQIESVNLNSENDSSEELVKAIHESLKRSALPILKNAIDNDRSKWEKDSSRKLAWELYARGLSQRDIANQCEHKQAWVSKLLAEKSLSENISQEAAMELIRRPEFQPIRKDPEGVDRMIEQLRNYLISSEQEETKPLLRQMINEVLNQ